jgi:hypothetical protein
MFIDLKQIQNFTTSIIAEMLASQRFNFIWSPSSFEETKKMKSAHNLDISPEFYFQISVSPKWKRILDSSLVTLL